MPMLEMRCLGSMLTMGRRYDGEQTPLPSSHPSSIDRLDFLFLYISMSMSGMLGGCPVIGWMICASKLRCSLAYASWLAVGNRNAIGARGRLENTNAQIA
jgi:hypothetical protein